MLQTISEKSVGLLERLLLRPEVKALEAEDVRQREARRAARVKELEMLNATDLHDIREKHEPALAAALTDVTRAEAALQAARDAYAAVYRAQSAARYDASERRARLEHELRLTASPAIDAFVKELREDLLPRTFAARDSVREKTIACQAVMTWSNDASVRARAEAIWATVRAAETWYLEALTDDEIRARCDQCRAALPIIEERPKKYRWSPNDAA